MGVCAVIDCKNNQNQKDISFFRFPDKEKDSKRHKIWVDRCKRKGLYAKTWSPAKGSRICEHHFDRQSFVVNPVIEQSMPVNFRIRLKTDAVPTIFKYKGNFNTSPTKNYDVTRPVLRKKELNKLLAGKADPSTPTDTETDIVILTENVPHHMSTQYTQPPAATSLLQYQTTHTDNSNQFPYTIFPQQTSLKNTETPVKTPATPTLSSPQCGTLSSPSGLLESPYRVEIVMPPKLPLTFGKSKTYVKGTQTRSQLVSAATQYSEEDLEVANDKVTMVSTEVQCVLIGQPLTCNTIESEDSEEEMEVGDNEEDDPTWLPGEDLSSEDESCDELPESTASPLKERKYIVFQSCLLSLFSMCLTCFGKCTSTIKNIGAYIQVTSVCHDGHVREWSSGPLHEKLPVANLCISAGLLFSGCSPVKLLNFFRHMNIAGITQRSYFRIQKHYLIPAVKLVWNIKQTSLLDERKGRAVRLAGDGRCCSPGHTAKYGSYTLMDADTGEILAMELVQCNEVKNSYNMELEGLKRSLRRLEEADVNVSDLVTDRHSQVRKWLRDEHPQIRHWFDIWHVAKSVRKKLESAAKKRKCEQLLDWIKSIVNHLYWSATSSNGVRELVLEKWLSITRHLTNVHTNHGKLYKSCPHGSLERNWIVPGTKVHKELCAIVESTRLKNDVAQLSPSDQTAYLESYHKVVCYFASKHGHFFYESMESRLLLASLHFSENVLKDQAVTKDGKPRWRLGYSKAQGYRGRISEVKTDVTYGYVGELLDVVWTLRQTFPTYSSSDSHLIEPMFAKPPPVISSVVNKLSKEEVMQEYKSRYCKNSLPQ